MNRDHIPVPGTDKNPTRTAQSETRRKSGSVRQLVRNGEPSSEGPPAKSESINVTARDAREKVETARAKKLADVLDEHRTALVLQHAPLAVAAFKGATLSDDDLDRMIRIGTALRQLLPMLPSPTDTSAPTDTSTVPARDLL